MEENWERPPRVELSLAQLNQLIEPAFPGRSIAEHTLLGTGLANTNLRFRLHEDSAEYVLRLHTRDRAAAQRELALMTHLRQSQSPAPVIPVPPLVYSDPQPQRGEHPYSIWGFVPGALLQDLFRTLPAAELVAIAEECGRVLGALSAHRFPRCGAFGPALQIAEEYGRPSDFVPSAIERALFAGRAGSRLGAALGDELWRAVRRWAPLLRRIDDHYTLVHADYKRSNLLLERSPATAGGPLLGSSWRVSAVLDWEFAFAGPPLIDVGLFLRAGEALPEGFRAAFVQGYRTAGGELPEHWLPLSRLVDVLSQITFLDGAEERPRVFAESIDVVQETLRMLA